MAEGSPSDTLPSDAPDFGIVVDRNSFYGCGPEGIGTVYETADRAWRLSPFAPPGSGKRPCRLVLPIARRRPVFEPSGLPQHFVPAATVAA
jgi:hypothetical protein